MAISKHQDKHYIKYNEEKIKEGKLDEVIIKPLLLDEMDKKRFDIEANRKKADNLFASFLRGTSSNLVNNEILEGVDISNISLAKTRIFEKKSLILQWADKEEIRIRPMFSQISSLNKHFNEYLIAKALSKHHDKKTDEKIMTLIKSLKNEMDNLYKSSAEGRMAGCNIIAMTLDNYIVKTKNEKLPIDHIFLDEAGYASLIKTLTLTNNNVPITLLGDHKQLPPVYEVRREHPKSIEKTFFWGMPGIFIEDAFLCSSDKLLEAYKKDLEHTYANLKRCSLKATHRFGQSLAKILDKHIYRFGFFSAIPDETQIYFIDSKSISANANERSSIEESEIIAKLLDNNVLGDNFAILTPYRKQLNQIRQNINKLFYDSVMTVHQSQGNEWDTVVFSIVDDAKSGPRSYYFTNSIRKDTQGANLINTVISRAKKRLILVGN